MITPLTDPHAYLREDGVLYSAQFGDVYHSSSGALGQAEAVFLYGNNLPERWINHPTPTFTIVELGFGAGVNCHVTLEAWHHRPQPFPCHLRYIGIEAFPLSPHLLKTVWYTSSQEPLFLKSYDPTHTEQTIVWEDATLFLLFQDIHTALSHLRTQEEFRIDALYLDGFSPKLNPDLWNVDLFQSLQPLCHPGTTLASWCVAGSVRRSLETAGFWVKRMPGFGFKKQRLIGGLR